MRWRGGCGGERGGEKSTRKRMPTMRGKVQGMTNGRPPKTTDAEAAWCGFGCVFVGAVRSQSARRSATAAATVHLFTRSGSWLRPARLGMARTRRPSTARRSIRPGTTEEDRAQLRRRSGRSVGCRYVQRDSRPMDAVHRHGRDKNGSQMRNRGRSTMSSAKTPKRPAVPLADRCGVGRSET